MYLKRIILLLIFCLCAGICTEASVLYVDSSNTATTQNGQSWATAYSNLQAGINAASAGDSVWVAAGTYVASIGTFMMKAGVKVYGGFAGNETQFTDRNLATNITTLTETHNGPVITCWGAAITNATVIDGITVTTSAIAEGYRAIYNFLSSPTFSNCTIKNSSVGGMNNDNASPMVVNCTFLNNTVNYSGGPGGAMINTYSNATIINCSFIGNKAHTGSVDGNGGAIYNDNSNITIINCLFWKNKVTGVYNISLHGGGGGAVFNIFSSTNIVNCTFYANSANGYGTALNINTGSTSTIRNTIIWGNFKFGTLVTPSDPIVYSQGLPASNFTYNLVQGQAASSFHHNLSGSLNPRFADTINGDFQLQATSPCINMGLNSANTSVADLAGNARIQNSVIDLGALESSFGIPLPVESLGFTGRMQDNHTSLKWYATGARPGTTFEVQRSPDGNGATFKVLGIVHAEEGKEEYGFSDKEPLPVNFYRLRIKDEQNEKWSRIIMVSSAKTQPTSQVYPNPAGSKVTLYLTDPALIHTSAFLLSSAGTIVKTISLENYKQIIDLETVASGAYFLKLKDGTMLKLIKK